jgi:peptidoglycan/xylan/chitin deacetylase (PgdA/CDA1 family)
MYHRVAEPRHDPWELSVSPHHFAEQMKYLKQSRIPLPMGAFVKQLTDGTLPRLAVAVTFDDGYIDNLTAAKPILVEAGVPATVFLSTGRLGRTEDFWWDELARLILDWKPAIQGTVTIADECLKVELPALQEGMTTSKWRASDPPRSERENLYLEIWSRLRKLGARERQEGMASTRNLFHVGPPDPGDLPMRPEDVSDLITGPFVEVGAHTVTHQPLTTLSQSEQYSEVINSRDACASLVGRQVEGFAYPHGDLNQSVKELVRSSGFRWACSTRAAAVNRSKFDLFDLPRLQALNWDQAEFNHVLSRADDHV